MRSENGQAEERLRVLVAEGSASDLFWLEMVFKGSRLPYSIEVVTERSAEVLSQASADLILVDNAAIAEHLPPTARPTFVLADAAEKERCSAPLHFIEKPFTNEKLFECLAAADLSAWAARVVPV